MASQYETRQRITDQIVSALEKGNLPPWRKSWRGKKNVGTPTNIASRLQYRGINILILTIHQQEHGFESRWFGTFKQWNTECNTRILKRPDSVNPASWATSIVYFSTTTKFVENEYTGEEEEERFSYLKTYSVFNIEQVEERRHLEKYRADREVVSVSYFEDDDTFDRFLNNLGVEVCYHDSNDAFYRPLTDEIFLPRKGYFDSYADYVATLCHEIGHWSASRIGFNAKSYAENELFAEITSGFLMNALGMEQSADLERNHHAYLADWLQRLQNDNRFIFRASAAASKAVDFLLQKAGFHHQQHREESVLT